MNQVPILDSLRAAAAWSVCLYHFICSTIGLLVPGKITGIFYYGQFGTHVFFVISGFVIPWSMYHNQYKLRAFLKFVLKRFTRIEPPYIVSILLILLIAFIKSSLGYGEAGAYGQLITAKRVVLHFGYLINFFPGYAWLNGVYWTLAIEFQYYLVMALLFVLLIHQNRLVRYSGYALCFAGSLLVPDPGHVHFPFYAPLFLFGIIVFLRMAPIIGPIEFWIIFIVCFVFNYFYCEAVSSFLGGTTALVILFFNKIKVPVLNALGKISYSTYLVHPILGAAVINILSHRSAELWQKWLIIGLGITVTIISSYIMYWVVEKPSKKLASSINLQP